MQNRIKQLVHLGLFLGLGTLAQAQPDLTESFLTDRGLDRYTEVYLIDRISQAAGSDRDRYVARLSALYAGKLAATNDPTERDRLLRASNDLLNSNTDLELAGLHLAVTVARYRPAEEIAERDRLLLASDSERERARRTLGETGDAFIRIGQQLERDVLYQERRQRAETARNPGSVIPELADAIRNRSLAKFYAGWAIIYESALSGESAESALEQFAWVLDTPGETPSLERLPRSLLRFDHVARSAIGVATAYSLMGDHAAAFEWFEAIEDENIAVDQIRAQLISRKTEALARADRWEPLRKVARNPPETAGLGSANARLLAVLALTERGEPATTSSKRQMLNDIAAAALQSLVEMGELTHVVELSSRFSNLPLEGEGFAVAYVVGSDLFAQARAAHRNSGENAGSPSESTAVRGAYLNAAQRLQSALDAPDAAAHPPERARAAFDAAACLYYARQFHDAAQGFLRAESLATDDEQRERALWMAFVVADALTERGEDPEPNRSRIAERYLTEHPDGPRAATMLLRTLGSGLVSESQAANILREVGPDDPTHLLAQRELARLLYRRVRGVQGIARAEAATEFLDLARHLMTQSPRQAGAPSDDTRMQLARQVLDVALLLDPPLIEIAKETLELVDSLERGSAGSEGDDEFTLRRVQLALAENREIEARGHAGSFRDARGRFAMAATRLFWERSHTAWRRGRSVPKARILLADGVGFTGGSSFSPAEASVVAEAAAYLWIETADLESRQLALEIDRRLLRDRQASERTIRRFAGIAEDASLLSEAEDAWLTLMAAKPEGSPPWFEARYESLRLLAESDPERARVAFDQLAALYPSLGSEPWTSRLRSLDRSLPRPLPETSDP